MNNQTTFNPFSQNLAIVKSYFKKPLVLILAIIYAVSIGVSLVSGFMMGPVMSDMYQSMFSFTGSYDYMTEADTQIVDMLLSDGMLSTIILCAMLPSLIITALYATAYFIIYFKSKNESPDSTPKAGFTILFVLSILNLIYVAFAALIILLCVALIVFAAVMISQEAYMSSSESTMVTVIFSIIALVFVATIAVMLIYAISNFNYIKNARNSLTSVNLSAKGAGVYGVISLIFGIFTLLSALPTIVMSPFIDIIAHSMPAEFPIEVFASMGDIYLISGLLSLVSVSAMIIDAIIALGYKKHIKNITNSYHTPENNFDAPTQPAPVYNPPAQTEAIAEPVVFSDNAVNQSVKRCPRCSTVAKNDDVFCNACGTKL